jgi:lysophospholipase L1-like esterase
MTRFLLLVSLASSLALATEPPQFASSYKYLALGDSIAFGADPTANPEDPDNFVGYPELVAAQLRLKAANAACFGETSGHFLSLAAPDLGCTLWRAQYPLHIEYDGTQIDFAVEHLSRVRNTKLVTINLGANDLGVLLFACEGDSTCFLAGLPAVLTAYQVNLTTIFTRIQEVYDGPIVAVTNYVADYSNLPQVGVFTQLNGILISVAHAFGAEVADAFSAFGAASAGFGGSACAAGLLIELAPGVCDIHPSAQGDALIAQTVVAALD